MSRRGLSLQVSVGPRHGCPLSYVKRSNADPCYIVTTMLRTRLKRALSGMPLAAPSASDHQVARHVLRIDIEADASLTRILSSCLRFVFRALYFNYLARLPPPDSVSDT